MKKERLQMLIAHFEERYEDAIKCKVKAQKADEYSGVEYIRGVILEIEHILHMLRLS